MITTEDKFPFHIILVTITYSDGTVMPPIVIYLAPGMKDPRYYLNFINNL